MFNWDITVSNEKETQILNDKIISFNKNCTPFTQNTPFINLNFHIKNKQGSIIAGIQSLLYCWGMLYVDILFVEEAYRHQHLGSLLLSKVEAEGKSLGASLCHLDTFDWQAKDFYLKQGYEI